MKTNDDCRHLWLQSGLDYSDALANIESLKGFLSGRLKEHNKIKSCKMRLSRKVSKQFDSLGNIRCIGLRVNGDYFKRRECISFNPDGFVGFAGWASSENLEPILAAFIDWLESITPDQP